MIHEKQVKQGIHNRHFKVQNYSTDDAKQFDSNHKPILKDDEGNNNHSHQQGQQQFNQKLKPEQVLQKHKVQQKDQHQMAQGGNQQINFDSITNQGEIVKELKQQQQDLQENLKHGIKVSISTPQIKSIQVPPLAKAGTQKKSKKVDPQLFEKLYRQNLRSKVLFNSDPDVFLSEAECNAAYKLAAALANYDITDERSLKFAEIKCRSKVKLPRLQ